MQKRVSILIPAYNAASFIQRCLTSVLSQTYKNLEVIIVNDGSNDNTLELLESIKTKDKRVSIFSQENHGVAYSRNVLLDKACGEFLLFIDADDWIEQNMIEHLIGYMDSDIDIVFCSSDKAENNDEKDEIISPVIEVWDQERQLLEFMKHKRMTGMLWNKLIRKSLTDDVSFNPKTGYGEDAEFLWQILKKSRKMVVTNEILYHHVMERNSISHLSFNDKKYSAIPMWESIVNDCKENYQFLLNLSIERLMCAAVFSLYEIKQCDYSNVTNIKHLKEIVKSHIVMFLFRKNVSMKFKLFALYSLIRSFECGKE